MYTPHADLFQLPDQDPSHDCACDCVERTQNDTQTEERSQLSSTHKTKQKITKQTERTAVTGNLLFVITGLLKAVLYQFYQSRRPRYNTTDQTKRSEQKQ